MTSVQGSRSAASTPGSDTADDDGPDEPATVVDGADDGGDVAAPTAGSRAGAKRGGTGRLGRPRGPRRSRGERRNELLDAAERAIRRIGPQASMDELAAEAGITKPILYSHFGDKAGLAAGLSERVAAELQEAIATSLVKAQHPEQVVASTTDAFCSFIESETELYHFLWYAALNQPDGEGPRVMIGGFASQIAFALRTALQKVDGDPSAAEPWSHAIVGLTLSAGEWWLHHRTMSRDQLVDYLTRLLWGGLAGAGFDRLGSSFSLGSLPAGLVAPDPGDGADGDGAAAPPERS